MSERLTKRLLGSNAPYTEFADYNEIIERLCDLEDKIEQGEIVELPCKIGHTVYCIRYDKARKPFVKPLGVLSFTTYGRRGFTVFTTKEDIWGVTAFATAQEAEKALERSENGKS